MTLDEFVTNRVKVAYRDEDIPCIPTILRTLGELFERYHVPLYRFCLRMTGNTAVSEDLVQDIFMRMLKHRMSFKPNTTFTPWMYRIARNACIDHIRRLSKAPEPTRSSWKSAVFNWTRPVLFGPRWLSCSISVRIILTAMTILPPTRAQRVEFSGTRPRPIRP